MEIPMNFTLNGRMDLKHVSVWILESSVVEGCSDSDGNPHEFYSEWENGPETCVCVDFGVICCGRFWDDTVHMPESTPGIIGDYFGAFTENDVGETEEPRSTENVYIRFSGKVISYPDSIIGQVDYTRTRCGPDLA
ncbi:hypothetical protein DPX16_15485 [Anabarilius grahami]|uniref:Uncharacterized protein n=1 Tax=Anabarilius grahami TaxID=495550 RepID=A0A3N0XW59_ANAGA|nr:hypothetical protein DPX16_15485 [Anabarilius grahami]